ncbi:MAG: hypothetical protein OHK0052_15850 [Anaerolineales bacterium]
MPAVIAPETLYVDDLPGIWSPVQWEQSPEEREQEIENQSRASLLAAIDVPEAILRLLLDEIAIVRAYEPPKGYDPEQQGDWDENLITFEFKHPIELKELRREPDCTTIVYDFKDFGEWIFEITPTKVIIERI